MAQIDWQGYDRLDLALGTLIEFDAAPLMDQWGAILIEGNRRGVLSGVDGNNQPMPPLKYRGGFGIKTRNRRVPDFGTTLFESTGIGPYASGLNDNLSSAEYRKQVGPRLAPRGQASRAIKNLHQAVEYDPLSKTWYAVCAWFQVVSTDNVPFLPYHFEGTGRLPKYDLRPVRPEDVQFCVNALNAYVKANFLSRF